jgi:hypothetical protein
LSRLAVTIVFGRHCGGCANEQTRSASACDATERVFVILLLDELPRTFTTSAPRRAALSVGSRVPQVRCNVVECARQTGFNDNCNTGGMLASNYDLIPGNLPT